MKLKKNNNRLLVNFARAASGVCCIACCYCCADHFNEGLIVPSLIRQLKSILDQYPDDGQILKVSFFILFRLKLANV